MPVATPDTIHFTPGTPVYGGLAPPTPGDGITIRTLENMSDSVQAADFVAPMFGLPLKEGDLPAGQWPQFAVDGGGSCAATVFNMAHWADGSGMMCGVLIRVPEEVAGSGSLVIDVNSGGVAPISSSRSLAEVTAGSDLKIEFTGTTNLSGTWVASLNDAIANDGSVVLIGDGPAGKVWRVGGHFKQSGSAHGQLYAWHYIAAIQNAAGGLLGIRYLCKFGQLFGDVASPAPLYRVGTMVLKNGATTVRTMQGIVVRPSPSTEPGTPGSSISIAHFAAAASSGPDATWDFFQCGGSASSDSTVRVVPDTAYVQRTKLVPPYGTTRTVTDTPAVDYFINGKGNHQEYLMGGTGEIHEIGLMPSWCASYWINPSAANERAVRVNAFCAFAYLMETRPVASKKPPTASQVNTYEGIESKPGWKLGTREGGIIDPAQQNNVWGTAVSHLPSPIYSSYLMTGDPCLLDTMVAFGCGHVLLASGGYSIWKAARPLSGPNMTSFAGIGGMRIDDAGEVYDLAGVLMRRNGIRMGAWAFRDIAQAFAMVPADYYDGDYKGYLGYIVDNGFRCFNDYMAAHPSLYQEDGMFAYSDRQTAGGDGLFMVDYFDYMLCHGSVITQNPRAIAARQYLGRRFNAVASRYNTACFSCYDYQVWTDDLIVESYSDVVWKMSGSVASLTFNASTNRVTVGNVAAPNGDWSPTNGDAFCFVQNGTNSGTRPYDEFVDFKRFYVVNASGKSFQFSATRDGSPLTIVRNFNMTSGVYYANIQDRVVGLKHDGTGGPQGYLAMSTGAMNFHHAVGDDVSLARAELQAHLAHENPNFTGNAKYAFQDAYPA